MKEQKPYNCKKGTYTTNQIILRSPIVCWGFGEELPCKYLKKCIEDNKESFSSRKFNSLMKKLNTSI